ncbi:RING/U-box superfamily protein [Rhynchospora pubera]|uniref:RING-type E3 ubiquitin transferase n=1 Tax=Rhynchospora pubera TaxID=906938 RepID=A0AAV8G087_9POAL|nr:RING/U-box superfamily protein [Rhynchospora pubera]
MEIQSTLILFILVVLCMLTFILIILLCRRIDTRIAASTTTYRRTTNSNTIGSMISAERENEEQGLHPTIVETFPIIPYISIISLKNVKGRHGCAVCLSEFENKDTLRMLPGCCHVFHPNCIGAWLDSHATCPICRSDLSDPDVLANDHCLIGGEKEPVVTEMKELEEDGRTLRRVSSMAVRCAGSGRWDALIKTLSGRWRKEGDSKRVVPVFVQSVDGLRDVEMGATSSQEQ